jgi:hypothetical protein
MKIRTGNGSLFALFETWLLIGFSSRFHWGQNMYRQKLYTACNQNCSQKSKYLQLIICLQTGAVSSAVNFTLFKQYRPTK